MAGTWLMFGRQGALMTHHAIYAIARTIERDYPIEAKCLRRIGIDYKNLMQFANDKVREAYVEMDTKSVIARICNEWAETKK